MSLIRCGSVYAQQQPAPQNPVIYGQLPSCSAAARFYSKDSINITTFGASTVHGMNGSDFQTPLQQDFEHCYKGKILSVTNNGIPGETTTQGLTRFQNAIAGRTGFILILMGANDATAMFNKKMRIAETEKNMRFYIEQSKKYNLIPIIGTLQFFNDTKNESNRTINLYIKQINALYKRLAQEYNIVYADINRALGRNFSLYSDDIHPNAQGNTLVAYVWFDAINKVIENQLLLIGLNQNYPNPVRDNAKIGFSLSQASHVKILLYSMNGANVKTIYDDYDSAGYHEFGVTLSDLAPGVYVYVMQVGGQRLSKKMVIVR
ncbi:GDSL-type esterase/lipase family protein [Mucilaginibacter sp. KACC 22063]|uniref:GDSL-type esterase/lipase family protein n=1 Tax=Mucilaginibacter sp. KACC 22063 TaxID=3025666 RepID=UPI002366D5E0|nr:GDSL-type esterase/lipase family protein [Mucilaginibacter sp. KACC 22063]WDF54047.1 GDSL-type esterase/lipase family protein [Mucilaginibacter sp. KACC 22063]